MERKTLQQQIDRVSEDVVSVVPAELPDLVREADPEGRLRADHFNLMIEEFEPLTVRRARRRWLTAVVLLLAVAGVLVIIGVSRRTAALTDRIEDLERQERQRYEEVFGARQLAELPPGLTPERLLTAEVRQLRRTRSDLPRDLQLSDAPADLAALLSVWRRELDVRTESIVVSESSLEVRVVLPTGDDVQQFSDALGRLDGWSLQPLQTRTVEEGVRAVLRFERSAGSRAATKRAGGKGGHEA
jgi:heme exporter protein D